MKLVAASAIRAALRFDSMSNLNTAIDAALVAATFNLSDALRNTPGFTRETAVVETFYGRPGSVLDMGNNTFPNYRTRLALRRGFLSANPTLVYAHTIGALTTAPIQIEAQYLLINREKGEVVIEGPDMRNQYVSVTSTRGFRLDTEDPSLFMAADVPAWLQQLAQDLSIALLFENNPELTPENSTRDTKALRLAALQLAAARSRYFPSALHPIN